MIISRHRTSQRSDVAAFIAMDVMSQAAALEAQGRSVVHMEVGQPGFPAPQRALDAVKAALPSPLGYTVALGRDELRAGVAALYRDWYGLDLDPRRVVVTTGSSAGFQLAFLSLFDAGDRVAIADPGYPSYRNILKALDLNVVRIEGQAETGFQPTPDAIRAAAKQGRIDGLLAASPANPTGAILDRTALTALIDACHAGGTTFISDEIYHGLHFDERAVSALEISDDVIVINSFSKYFAMTGWRIGWMVVPEALIPTVERLAQNLFICPPHVSQVAALGALSAHDELEVYRQGYARNRALLLERLPQIGVSSFAPCDGAFYLYADIGHLTRDSRAWCEDVLINAGVALTPGLDFDPVRGGQSVRVSFAGAQDQVAEGLDRLADYLTGKRG